MIDNQMGQWYLCYSKPRQEAVAHAQLLQQGYESYLPLAVGDSRIKEKSRIPLYPSYFFIRLIPGVSDFATVGYTIGVRWLVKTGQHYHIADDSLIECLKGRENKEGLITAGQNVYQVGDRVMIISGPFKNYHGIINGLRKNKADIWFYTAGTEIMGVDLDALEPYHTW